jgi:DNA-binding transcriptional MocR family regulator
VLARLIESGRFDRHLRRMRKIYAGQRDALFAALDEHAPDIRRTGLAASFHAVAQLARAPAKLTWSRLRGPGVGIYGMSANRSTIRAFGWSSCCTAGLHQSSTQSTSPPIRSASRPGLAV